MNGVLTKKGRVAVAAMFELAISSESTPVPLAVVGERQQISLSYLEQLFGRLRRHELVQSTRGAGGGYVLAREADSITLADIIAAVDEPGGLGGRSRDDGPAEGSNCLPVTQELWDGANARLVEYFESISLQALVDDRIAKGLVVKPVSVRRGISSRRVIKPIHVSKINWVFALADTPAR